jgi:hypothetical protein
MQSGFSREINGFSERVHAMRACLLILFAVLVFLILLFMVELNPDFFDRPILSEKNPNGTIDYWYLFSGAER